MNKELAHHFAYQVFRSQSNINSLIPLLKKHCDEKEHKILSKKIAAISADIMIELLRYVFEEYPEIKEEIDNKIEKYGILTF